MIYTRAFNHQQIHNCPLFCLSLAIITHYNMFDMSSQQHPCLYAYSYTFPVLTVLPSTSFPRWLLQHRYRHWCNCRLLEHNSMVRCQYGDRRLGWPLRSVHLAETVAEWCSQGQSQGRIARELSLCLYRINMCTINTKLKTWQHVTDNIYNSLNNPKMPKTD